MSNSLFPLPNRIEYGSSVGRRFSTWKVRTATGALKTNRNWANPLRTWTLDVGALTETEAETLLAFIDTHGGDHESFLLEDPHSVLQGTPVQYRVRFTDSVQGLDINQWKAYGGTLELEEDRT